MKDNAPDTYYWVMDGVNEIYAFFKGDFSNGYYFGYISDTQRYTLPDNYKILFGVGQGVMGSNKYGISSDIGYVNDIWMGGVFYCILIYGIFSWFLFSFLKGKQFKIDRFFFLLFSATFIFSNIKGSIFSRNNYTTLFFLFYFFIVLCKENISCSKSDVK